MDLQYEYIVTHRKANKLCMKKTVNILRAYLRKAEIPCL